MVSRPGSWSLLHRAGTAAVSNGGFPPRVGRYTLPSLPVIYHPPPFPKKDTPLPAEAYVKEMFWPHWQGSPAEVARLAGRADQWMREHFIDFQEPRFEEERRGWPRGMEFPQMSVSRNHSVTTAYWSSSTSAHGMRDEIEARRSQVTTIEIQSTVIDRTWSRLNVFEHALLKQISPPTQLPPGGFSVSFETMSPPQRIELIFQTQFPAARLRVIAAGPNACASLYDHMAPHIEAGARPHVWDPGSGGLAGALAGASVGACFYTLGVLWLPIVLQAALGSAGWLAGYSLVRWAFPPLELVESWERSRWETVTAYGWQALLFFLGAAGVALTVVLST